MLRRTGIFLLVSGCSWLPFAPDEQVTGLESLKKVVRIVPDNEVFTECAKYFGAVQAFLMMPMACTNINLDTWTATSILGEHASSGAIAHELDHREGRWHDGSLQEYVNRWRGL